MSNTDELAADVLNRILQAAEAIVKKEGPKGVYVNSFSMDVGETDLSFVPYRSGHPKDLELVINVKTATAVLKYLYSALRAREIVYGPSGEPIPHNLEKVCSEMIAVFQKGLEETEAAKKTKP